MMAPYDTIKWMVFGTTFFATTIGCVEINPSGALPEFRSLDHLTETLNQLAVQSKLPIKIAPGKKLVKRVVRGPIVSGGMDSLKKIEGTSNSEAGLNLPGEAVSGTPLRLGSLRNGLPLAEARVVSPVRSKWNSKEFTESPWLAETNLKERDVVATFTPPFTRFGTDRYDKAMFDSSPKDPASNLLDDQVSNDGAARATGGLVLGGEPPQEAEKNKKTGEQEARESLQKTIKEFADRDDEKESFQLVDYFDLRNVLARNSQLLSSFENDEIDERFVKNAQIVFERFGGRDNAPDKKTFESFLKKMEPPSPQFKSFNLDNTNRERRRGRHSQR